MIFILQAINQFIKQISRPDLSSEKKVGKLDKRSSFAREVIFSRNMLSSKKSGILSNARDNEILKRIAIKGYLAARCSIFLLFPSDLMSRIVCETHIEAFLHNGNKAE